jgi:hypothetical protein
MKHTAWLEGWRVGKAFPNSWKEFCPGRRRKRELELAPPIREEKHVGTLSKMKEAEIVDRQNKDGGAKDASIIQIITKKGKFELNFGLLLAIVGVAFLFFTFGPFQAGWISILLSVGFVGVTIFCLHTALKSYYETRWLVLGISSLCVAFALFGHVMLSLIRGELFKELYRSSNAGFYSSASNYLGIALPFLSLAVELGAALGMFLGIEKLWSADVHDYRNLEKYRERMIAADAEIERLKNLPEQEEIEFSEGATQGALEALAPIDKNKLEKKLAWIIPITILIIIILALFTAKAFGDEQERPIVIAADLTKSSLSKDKEGLTEFEKNIKGVESVLATVEPGSRIVIIGITDKSFTSPLILLDKVVPKEPGYFKEKIKDAREKLVAEWKEKAKTFKVESVQSDVFGALELAAHIINGATHGELIIFSDLRHYAGGFDLESLSKLDYEKLLKEVEAQGLIPSLKGVEIFCLGVHGEGKSYAYWQSLSHFWEGYFAKSQGNLKIYSILRSLKND